jgi:hypothetical protein
MGAGKNMTTLHWSVTKNENIRWRTPLPETGQSGIAVAQGRLFLTTMRPVSAQDKKDGTDIVGYCLDAKTGKILWSVPLAGDAENESPYAYSFSDSSTPTPVTEGKYVWFVNASGRIVCCDFSGTILWERVWKPTIGRPFNKQFEPILHGDWLLNLEPRDMSDPKREKDPWNYIQALDKKTGKVVWVSEDALTHYNTPIKNKGKDGWSLLIGRGGYHDVPEAPIGLSLISLEKGNRAGKMLWRYAGTGKALYNMHWDAKLAYWIDLDKAIHTILDARTGAVLRQQPLDTNADWRRWDNASKQYFLETGVNFKERGITVFPAWFTNIPHAQWHYFLCFSNPEPAYGIGPCGPMHCVGRVHLTTGKVEYLELPVAPGVYSKTLTSSTVNSRGVDVMSDPRSRRDGWHWAFLGSPIAIGKYLLWTTMLGVTYVLDGEAPVLDARALVSVNDLGAIGETWSLNTPTHHNGLLYHRTMKEVVCING